MGFKPAGASTAWAKVALFGASGDGKTYSMLRMARRLAAETGSRIAVIDSEHGKSQVYRKDFCGADGAPIYDVDDEWPQGYGPMEYVAKMQDAARLGYRVLIIDSLSHAWQGAGGALELVDRATAKTNSKNKFTSGWSEVTPQQNAMVEAILAYPGHVLVGMRAKTEYVMETDIRGKALPKKVGLGPVQRDGVEYEFDVLLAMSSSRLPQPIVIPGTGKQSLVSISAVVQKSRLQDILPTGAVVEFPGEDVADALLHWLRDEGATQGSSAQHQQQQAPAPTPEPEPLPITNEAIDQSIGIDTPARPLNMADEMEYHPSWPAARDSFSQTCRSAFVDPEVLADWCEGLGRSRPSAMTPQERDSLLGYVFGPNGTEVLTELQRRSGGIQGQPTPPAVSDAQEAPAGAENTYEQWARDLEGDGFDLAKIAAFFEVIGQPDPKSLPPERLAGARRYLYSDRGRAAYHAFARGQEN